MPLDKFHDLIGGAIILNSPRNKFKRQTEIFFQFMEFISFICRLLNVVEWYSVFISPTSGL
jgi:hypothetical protein